jgi:hypothetical protein
MLRCFVDVIGSLQIGFGEQVADFVSYRERAAINLQLISDLCDLTAPTAALGWTGFDDGIVGLAGTVSSLIGVYGAWKKTA